MGQTIKSRYRTQTQQIKNRIIQDHDQRISKMVKLLLSLTLALPRLIASSFLPPSFEAIQVENNLGADIVASSSKPSNANWIYNQITDAWYAPTSSGGITYQQAGKACIQMANGAYLADIQNSDEANFVVGNYIGTNYWVSGLSTPDHNSWYASSYSSTYKMSYLPWHKGEPSGDGDCVQAAMSDYWNSASFGYINSNYLYNDAPCDYTSDTYGLCKFAC